MYKPNLPLVCVILFTFLITGCTHSFSGNLFVFNFRDLILYVIIAFLLAVFIAIKSTPGKRKTAFWIWFILSLILTPLSGFIYLLVLLTRGSK